MWTNIFCVIVKSITKLYLNYVDPARAAFWAEDCGSPFSQCCHNGQTWAWGALYQITTEMLILQYEMLGTVVTFWLSNFFFFTCMGLFYLWIKVPLFLFLTVYIPTFNKTRILQTFGNQYINSCIPVTLCEVSHFWIQILQLSVQFIYIYFSSLCNILMQNSVWLLQSGR